MNEFIKKLIERLEEYQENNTQCKSSDDYELGLFNACENEISIVNQLAEEYKNESVKGDLISRSLLLDCLSYYISHTDEKSGEHYAYERAKDLIEKQPTECNDAWIPVSSGNPKETGLYQVTVDDNDEPVITAMYLAEVDIWSYHAGYGNYMKVLAWRSLPQPYQPKGE